MTPVSPTTLKAIEELKPLAEELNAQSNDLNQIITAISERLASLNLGIEVWFPSESNSDIGFGKVDGRWTLAVRTGQRQDGGEFITLGVTPLTKCSRDKRIEGLAFVPQIVTRLSIETAGRLKKIAEAKQLAERL